MASEAKVCNSVTLEKIRIGCMLAMSKHALEAGAEFHEDWARNSVDIQVRGYLWGHKIGVQQVEWPADWWQHFKQRWFPRTWLQKWPVRMTKRTFVAKALYPDYKAIFPNQRVVMAMYDETEWLND